MRYSRIAAALVLWTASVAAAGEHICPRVTTPPTIDGRLDDPAWAGAVKLTDFTLPKTPRPPAKGIEVRLCFDDRAIYIAFVCAEPAPKRIKALARPGSDDVWKDDCVEVWIRTTDSSLEFDQFIVNTLGTRQSLRRRQRRDLPPWKPRWTARVRVEASRWIAEIRIPLADLALARPQAGDMVQVKLGREDHTGAETVLSTWPGGSPYAGTEGYAPVYFERANLLPNPDMSQADGGNVKSWGFHKSDAGLFASVAEGARRVIRFRTPGRYTTASQSIRLRPNARYRLEAEVKGTAGIYLRSRIVHKRGGPSVPYTAHCRASKGYVKYEVPFPTGPDGRALILIGNTEGGGKGEVHIAGLAVVREQAFDVFGPAIPVAPAPAEPTVIRKLAVADCRALKGFAASAVDGTTRTRGWSGGVWEYNQGGTGTGVRYSYRGSDGLHITLADKGGFHAVLIRGGARVKMYRDCPRFDEPAGGKLLAGFPGRTTRCRAWFDEPVRTNRVSFFELTDGRLADVSFFRVSRGAEGLPQPETFGTASLSVGPGQEKRGQTPFLRSTLRAGGAGKRSLSPFLRERFEKRSRLFFAMTQTVRKPAGLAAAKGRTFHLISAPFAQDTPLLAVGVDLAVREGPTPMPLTLAVQDPMNPRCQLLGADIVLSKPGRCRVVLDFPDQIVPKGAVLWLSITAGAAAKIGPMTVNLYKTTRERAHAQALAYRKLLLKTYFCALSEPRPWNGWYDDRRLKKSLAEPRWGPQLKELIMTLAQCKQLGPKDDLVRQYDEWIWRRYRPRRKTMPAFEPRIDKVPGAPQWAVVARQAWLTAREVPRWWIENRMVPTGEFGGQIGDDTDMYQNYADLPMFEAGGVAAMVRDGAERLAELAERETLERGLNRRTMDPLHAYEEGLNQEALLAWWNYGDPVYLERCIVAARSTEALTVVTPKGHRHFKSQDCGAADLRMDRKTDVDGHAHPLMWHPTLEVAWYNRNPRALKHLRQWADGWLEHMQPGRYATSVEVATERVVGTTHRPLYGGYGGQGSAMLFLYWITGDEKYLGPFFEEFRKGSRSTSPHLILPELIHRHGLAFLGEKLKTLVSGEGPSETLVTGDKRPLIEAFKQDIAELQRFPAMYTTTEPYTDRVFLYAIRNAAIAYTGGYASRNKLCHTHAVSWEGLGTDYAALVLRARPDALKVLVYNFADRPLPGRMRVWTLDHGEYRLRAGPDTNGDDRMDRAARDEKLELLRASAIPLTLRPKEVTVIELAQLKRLDDERNRADLALSPREVRIEKGTVHGVAHNIGSKPVASFDVALVDAAGKVRVRKTLGPLDAPLDLVPRRLPFTLGDLPAGAKGWTLVLDPGSRIPEIFDGNNRVQLGAE